MIFTPKFSAFNREGCGMKSVSIKVIYCLIRMIENVYFKCLRAPLLLYRMSLRTIERENSLYL